MLYVDQAIGQFWKRLAYSVNNGVKGGHAEVFNMTVDGEPI